MKIKFLLRLGVILSLLALFAFGSSNTYASEEGDKFCLYSQTSVQGLENCNDNRLLNRTGWHWGQSISSLPVQRGPEFLNAFTKRTGNSTENFQYEFPNALNGSGEVDNSNRSAKFTRPQSTDAAVNISDHMAAIIMLLLDDDIDPNDLDGDGVANDQDAFPNDPNESVDSDGDGIGDNADTDRDGDGVENDQDAFPNDPNESGDIDGDGIGDNADTDRDGDGVENDQDLFPTAMEWVIIQTLM